MVTPSVSKFRVMVQKLRHILFLTDKLEGFGAKLPSGCLIVKSTVDLIHNFQEANYLYYSIMICALYRKIYRIYMYMFIGYHRIRLSTIQ